MIRGSSASQSMTVSLPASPAAGGTRSRADVDEAGLGEIAFDLGGGEAEPAMREIAPQEFLLMRVEIDDDEPPAGRERPRRLARARGPDRRGSAAPDG